MKNLLIIVIVLAVIFGIGFWWKSKNPQVARDAKPDSTAVIERDLNLIDLGDVEGNAFKDVDAGLNQL